MTGPGGGGDVIGELRPRASSPKTSTVAARPDCPHTWGSWRAARGDDGQTALDVTPGREIYQYRACHRCGAFEIREQLRFA